MNERALDLIPCPQCDGSARRVAEIRGLNKYLCIAGHVTLRAPGSVRMTERVIAQFRDENPQPVA